MLTILIVGSMSSDPLFSLIIFIYVAVVFLYMFYAFCWKEPEEEEDPDKKVVIQVIISYNLCAFKHLSLNISPSRHTAQKVIKISAI